MCALPNSIYYLPCKPGSVYVNVTNTCLNDCLFCIKRKGPVFYGVDLSLDRGVPSPSEIAECFESLRNREAVKEVVFCGMGEPLLRHDCVMKVCRKIRETMERGVSIRVDTSGLFWSRHHRSEILGWIDVLCISLNAENAEKYDELCRPRIARAYEVLMSFLHAIKAAETEQQEGCLRFPKVRLSVVDTSEAEYVPASGTKGYAPGAFPVPDLGACRRIAADFGWPLVVKRLFRDSCEEQWSDPGIQEMCARGIPIERCRNCSYRH